MKRLCYNDNNPYVRTSIQELKLAVIMLEREFYYTDVISIIDEIKKNLKLSENRKEANKLIRKCNRTKRRLRIGFLGRLDDSRIEIGKLIYAIKKFIKNEESSHKTSF